ncbi:hypothetical protein BC941DRAFT_438377 [Chlamydoabsidia padenii]|nr:hypothetical protein BC941DRAFT_438377 [Chlamydoabsidia padenii]
MTDYGLAPVIRLPKSKVDNRYFNQVNGTLVSETLYLVSFPSTVTESNLHLLLQQYQPLEIQLYRHNGEGYLRFRDASIADQVYALYQDFQFNNGSKLHFSVYPNHQHEAQGVLLKVNRLPRHIDNTFVYHLFRPFGPLALCKLLLEQDDTVFLGTALIQYFYHEHSESAIQAMHGQLVHGNRIVVEPLISNDHYQKSADDSLSMNPDKSSDSNYVDVMNLYVKNLDPKVNNNDLFDAFRPFGRIVSARVMTNPANNQSKGYGFVSYSRSDEARLALEQMNGKLFYQKPLMVSFHAPKKPRQAPPTPSSHEYSSPYPDSGQQQHSLNSTPSSNSMVSSTINGLGIDNVDQLAMDIKDLSIGQHYPSTSPYPIQRKSSIADSYMSTQQVRMSPPFSSSPISGSTGHSLASLASGLSVQQMPTQQYQSTTFAQTAVSGLNKYKQTSDGRPTLRRKSSLESVCTVMTESSANLQRQKLTLAVLQCGMVIDDQTLVSDIVDMLLTLKKKERSLCLFNQDFIKAKILLALEALEIFHDGDDSDEDEEEEALQKMIPRQPVKKISPVKSTPLVTTMDDNQSYIQEGDIPKSIPIRISKAIPIVAPSDDKETNGLTEENKEFIESLKKDMEGKRTYVKKQLLGDRLFPLVKATGTKQAPKVTIALLDSVDLIELATLMFDKDALKKQVDAAFATINQ